jgi:cell division transport system permease protein
VRAFRAGLASIRRAPLVQFIAVSTVAVAFLLVGLLRIAGTNLDRLAKSFGQGVQVTVYLEDAVSAARTKKIADAIVHLPGVAAARVVDSTEAFERLRQSLGDRGGLLEGVDPGLLPVSIEVSFRDGLAGAARLRGDFDQIKQSPGVEDVEQMGDWVDRLLAAERLLRLGALILGGLVALACLHVVHATIRLGIFARREEIEILRLVGATDRFVRAPYLVEGALQGLTGAALGLGILYTLFRAAAPVLERALGAALTAVRLGFLGPREVLLGLAAGAFIGMAGSNLALSRHARR